MWGEQRAGVVWGCMCGGGHIGVLWCLPGGAAVGQIGVSVWRQKDVSICISFLGGKLIQPGAIRVRCCSVLRELCAVWPGEKKQLMKV